MNNFPWHVQMQISACHFNANYQLRFRGSRSSFRELHMDENLWTLPIILHRCRFNIVGTHSSETSPFSSEVSYHQTSRPLKHDSCCMTVTEARLTPVSPQNVKCVQVARNLPQSVVSGSHEALPVPATLHTMNAISSVLCSLSSIKCSWTP